MSSKTSFITPTDPTKIPDEPDELARAKHGKGMASFSRTIKWDS